MGQVSWIWGSIRHTAACVLLLLPVLVACASNNEAAEVAQRYSGHNSDNQSTSVDTLQAVANGSHAQVDPYYLELAYTHLDNNRDQLGLSNPRNELTPMDYREDNLRFMHIKFQQAVGGIPVWGGHVIVHINSSDDVYRVTGQPYHGLQDINTSPVLTKVEAENIAVHAGKDSPGGWQPSTTLLYVFPEKSGARLVYEVTVTNGLKRKFVIIDAGSGQLVKTLSGTPTLNR